jgi:hypothetical protein
VGIECPINQLWSLLLLEKTQVTQLLNNFPKFMQLEDLLPSSEQPATGPYHEPR